MHPSIPKTLLLSALYSDCKAPSLAFCEKGAPSRTPSPSNPSNRDLWPRVQNLRASCQRLSWQLRVSSTEKLIRSGVPDTWRCGDGCTSKDWEKRRHLLKLLSCTCKSLYTQVWFSLYILDMIIVFCWGPYRSPMFLQTVVSIAYQHIDECTKHNSQPQIRGLQCFLHRNGTALDLCIWVLVALGCARITTNKWGPRSSAHEQTLVMWRSRSTACLE